MSKEKSNEVKDNRTRNWNFLVWIDCPCDWRAILDEEHIEWIESPLHDRDVNADGTEKKHHWHITVLYDGVKSYSQIKELTDKLNTTIPQRCASVRGSVRYMAHLDNPEKAQYDPAGIVSHGGADLVSILSPTRAERYRFIAEMTDYIDEKGITEFSDLFRYAKSERFEDWFPLLCDNSAYVIGQYIKSCRHRASPQIVKVDGETGEVIE